MRTWLLVISILGVVSKWATKALEDDRITLSEIACLIIDICTTLNLDTAFSIGGETYQTTSKKKEVIFDEV